MAYINSACLLFFSVIPLTYINKQQITLLLVSGGLD